jgi:hypothetical protein
MSSKRILDVENVVSEDEFTKRRKNVDTNGNNVEDKENRDNSSVPEDNTTEKYSKIDDNDDMDIDRSSSHSVKRSLIDYENNDVDVDGLSENMFEAGIIVKIEMEDFMIHRKFTVKFGKQVNFLTGKNGSGV